jgi:hypothetical protein
MNPIKAIAAPVLAQLYANAAEANDRAAGEIRRLQHENDARVARLNETIKRVTRSGSET